MQENSTLFKQFSLYLETAKLQIKKTNKRQSLLVLCSLADWRNHSCQW